MLTAKALHSPPKEPEPIFLPRRYLRPTRSSMAAGEGVEGGDGGAREKGWGAPPLSAQGERTERVQGREPRLLHLHLPRISELRRERALPRAERAARWGGEKRRINLGQRIPSLKRRN